MADKLLKRKVTHFLQEYYCTLLKSKINYLLQERYNLFHSDLIYAALYSDEISYADFWQGVYEINKSEMTTDDDEFVPSQFECLINK